MVSLCVAWFVHLAKCVVRNDWLVIKGAKHYGATSSLLICEQWTRYCVILSPGSPRGGQKGSLSGGSGTQGGPGFRIVRFRILSSSAQTTASGRDDFFLFRVEIRTSADAMILFSSSLDVEPKFEHLRSLGPFFCSSLDFGPKFEHLRTLWPFFAYYVIMGHHWIFSPGPEISLGAPASIQWSNWQQHRSEYRGTFSKSTVTGTGSTFLCKNRCQWYF